MSDTIDPEALAAARKWTGVRDECSFTEALAWHLDAFAAESVAREREACAARLNRAAQRERDGKDREWSAWLPGWRSGSA